jgi:phage shock protein C
MALALCEAKLRTQPFQADYVYGSEKINVKYPLSKESTMSEYNRLYRSRDHRMIAGVAYGLGEFLGIDPTIIRLLFVFSIFLGGTGALVYFVMMLVVPEEPLEGAIEVTEPEAKEKKK